MEYNVTMNQNGIIESTFCEEPKKTMAEVLNSLKYLEPGGCIKIELVVEENDNEPR